MYTRKDYLVPHSTQRSMKNRGLMRSKQQKMGFSRSVSQHGSGLVVGAAVVGAAVGATVGETVVGAAVGEVGERVVGAAVGAAVGQSVVSAVPTQPLLYPAGGVPVLPTLTRGPHSPALVCTALHTASHRPGSKPRRERNRSIEVVAHSQVG